MKKLGFNIYGIKCASGKAHPLNLFFKNMKNISFIAGINEMRYNPYEMFNEISSVPRTLRQELQLIV